MSTLERTNVSSRRQRVNVAAGLLVLTALAVLHVRARVITQAERASVANTLDVPAAWVHPRDPVLLLPARRLSVVSAGSGEAVAGAILHGSRLFALSLPHDSPMQRWRTDTTLSAPGASVVAMDVVSRLFHTPRADLETRIRGSLVRSPDRPTYWAIDVLADAGTTATYTVQINSAGVVFAVIRREG